MYAQVILDNGLELPADVVVVGAGVVPNAAFVTGVAKAPDGAIKAIDDARTHTHAHAPPPVSRACTHARTHARI